MLQCTPYQGVGVTDAHFLPAMEPPVKKINSKQTYIVYQQNYDSFVI